MPAKTPDYYFSRIDIDESFSSYAPFEFTLEGRNWPTVEHYYQAMKFENEAYQEKIRQVTHASDARKMGRTRFKKLRKDWKKLKQTYMTRAVYTKFSAHPTLARRLLGTGETRLVENSQYDYYWGCGRDRRGVNMYGQVLMNVREKLMEGLQGTDNIHAN